MTPTPSTSAKPGGSNEDSDSHDEFPATRHTRKKHPAQPWLRAGVPDAFAWAKRPTETPGRTFAEEGRKTALRGQRYDPREGGGHAGRPPGEEAGAAGSESRDAVGMEGARRRR